MKVNLQDKDYYIQIVLKILTFLMAINVVTSFIDGTIYFYFLLILTILCQFYFFIKDYKLYVKKYFWIILFFISCLISAFLSREYSNIYSVIKPLVMAIIVFNMISFKNYNTEKEFKYIAYFIIGYTFILGLYSLFTSSLSDIFSFLNSGRYSGIYLNPNQIAFWAFISLMLSFKYFNFNKVLFGLNILLELFLIIVSGCRSVYLALFFSLIAFIYFKNGRRVNKKIIIFLFISILIIIGFTLFRYKWLYKYVSTFNEEFLNVISGLRYLLWKDSLSVFKNNMIFGVGVDNLKHSTDSYFIINGGWEDSHNILITTLVYTGIVGFIPLFKTLSSVIKKSFKYEYYFIFIVSLFIISLLDIGIVFDNRILSVMFWYLAGIVINLE